MTLQVEHLFHILEQRGDRAAVFWRHREITAESLAADASAWVDRVRCAGIAAGDVCALRGDYSPTTVGVLLGLLRSSAVIVPLTQGSSAEASDLMSLGRVQFVIKVDHDENVDIERLPAAGRNELLEEFRRTGHPGLIVFTSGSTGTPKAILHDVERVLRKFEVPRSPYRTLQFLLMDHFGGINTLFSVLATGGVVVITEDRSPATIARLIEEAKVELLPATPTFLNLFLASGAFRAHDMSSVRLITYGTEPMPEATLARLADAFPNAVLHQTYGLSELGVLRSRSKDPRSLWVKVGGSGFETRIIDGRLHVRSDYSMVGYLNAPSPFDAEGWMDTGDVVIQEGEWLRILGRVSDVINVGGQKVFPAEVENVLIEAPNVIDASVSGRPHPLVGAVVTARVTVAEAEEEGALRARLRLFCRERLAPYKVPIDFTFATAPEHTSRFKKIR